LLRSALEKLYPHLKLPNISSAKEWHSNYTEYVKLLRLPEDKQTKEVQQRKNDLATWLHAKNILWCPPPHFQDEPTPVPASYFLAAAGAKTKKIEWSLCKQHDVDLVPVEQLDLIQDAATCQERAVDEILSAEGRACISITRPHSCFVKVRRMPGSSKLVSTQTHQSGELQLRPLTPDEDKARGMIGSLVATPDVLKEKFQLKKTEALQLVVPVSDNEGIA